MLSEGQRFEYAQTYSNPDMLRHLGFWGRIQNCFPAVKGVCRQEGSSFDIRLQSYSGSRSHDDTCSLAIWQTPNLSCFNFLGM